MASGQCPGVGCDHANLRKVGTDMVTVVVGPESSEEEFRIHTDLADRHSDIMVDQMDISRLRITERSAYHFKLFVAFLYTVYSRREDNIERSQEWRLLAELWSLGHALGSITFKDAVVDAMVQKRAKTNMHKSDIYKVLAIHMQTQAQVKHGVGKLLVDIAVSTRGHEVYSVLSPDPHCIAFYGEIILDESAEWENIAEAWLLADRILSVSLKDALVDKVISIVRDHGKVPTALHRDNYKGSAFKSGMRSLLIDIAAYSWDSGTLAHQPSDRECAEPFRDVGVAAMKRVNYAAIAPYIERSKRRWVPLS